MSLNFVGIKKGMTQVSDEEGKVVAATFVVVEPHTIVQIKTKEKDKYAAIQLGSVVSKKKVNEPLVGHFKKNGISPMKYLIESRLEEVGGYQVSRKIDLSYFSPKEFIDVIGTSKGKGFQGVMKLHNFSGGPASHGATRFHRKGGAIGMRSTPGRCFPGGKRASRMGGRRTTLQNLQVLFVDLEKNLLAIKGAIPGSIGSLVYIRKAKKKRS